VSVDDAATFAGSGTAGDAGLGAGKEDCASEGPPSMARIIESAMVSGACGTYEDAVKDEASQPVDPPLKSATGTESSASEVCAPLSCCVNR
jgi:hypothetical protein